MGLQLILVGLQRYETHGGGRRWGPERLRSPPPALNLSLAFRGLLPLRALCPPRFKDAFPLTPSGSVGTQALPEGDGPSPFPDARKERSWRRAGKRKVLACASWQGPGWNRREGSGA